MRALTRATDNTFDAGIFVEAGEDFEDSTSIRANEQDRPGPFNFESNVEFNHLLNDVRKILDSVFSSRHGKQVIGVTSAVPDEGKTTLAGIMALLSAERQENNFQAVWKGGVEEASPFATFDAEECGTLLIDAHFGNPSLHKKFGVSLENGLYEILARDQILEISTKRISSGLHLVTAGRKRDLLKTQLEEAKFEAMLEFSKRHYERIFLDLPSILHAPSAIDLSRLCDGVVVVVRAGKTRWEVVNQARELLEEADVKILGGILNRRRFYIPETLYRRI